MMHNFRKLFGHQLVHGFDGFVDGHGEVSVPFYRAAHSLFGQGFKKLLVSSAGVCRVAAMACSRKLNSLTSASCWSSRCSSVAIFLIPFFFVTNTDFAR